MSFFTFKAFKTIAKINFKIKLLKLLQANCFVSFSAEPKSVYVDVNSEHEISDDTDITIEKLEQLTRYYVIKRIIRIKVI